MQGNENSEIYSFLENLLVFVHSLLRCQLRRGSFAAESTVSDFSMDERNWWHEVKTNLWLYKMVIKCFNNKLKI